MTHYLLYLNLWGTTAKLLEGKELSPPSDAERCQAHFRGVLSRLALRHPSFSITHLADEAYVLSSELTVLVDAAARLLTEMMQFENEFRFWPLRGAIGLSSKLDHHEMPENFHSFCFFGAGAVEVARLEKSAQKGARLFLASNLAANLATDLAGVPVPVRERSTRGIAHCEVNWLTHAPQLHDALRAKAAELIEHETNYSLQMAGSLLDLIEWSKRGPTCERDYKRL